MPEGMQQIRTVTITYEVNTAATFIDWTKVLDDTPFANVLDVKDVRFS